MDYCCGLWSDGEFVASCLSKSFFVDLAVAADDSVSAVRDADLHFFAVGVQHHDDVAPSIATGIVFQSEGNGLSRAFEELQMLTNQFCFT